MMTLDKDGNKKGDSPKELKEINKNKRCSGSDNNDSVSYLGDEDDEHITQN
jgi:hypothetical protein